jgi:hypothetical protein
LLAQYDQSPMKTILQSAALVAGNEQHGNSLAVECKSTRQTPTSALNRISFRFGIRLPFSVSTFGRPREGQRRPTNTPREELSPNRQRQRLEFPSKVRVEHYLSRHGLSMAE